MAIVFGSAVHKFAEEFIKGTDSIQAIGRACKYFATTPAKPDSKTKHLDANFLVQCCQSVEEFLSTENFTVLSSTKDNGEREILCELKLALPVRENSEHAILLCGTIDILGQYNNGPYLIADWKTTNSYDVPKYLETYRLSTQMLMYRWFIRKLAKKHGPESIYHAINQSVRNQIFAISTAANKRPVITKSNLFDYSDALLDTYTVALEERINVIWAALNSGQIPEPTGLASGACSSFSGCCPYNSLCYAISADHAQMLQDQHFINKTYDPLTFR